ncbi:MAG: type II secretion system F family protein [Pirellulaceae bacterium]|jgi:tight adherence protein B|nr:type II secretion system F family protein [Pirellulaceae bacterium]
MILADLAVMSITFATVATALGAIGLFVRDLFSQPAAATRQRLGLAPEEPAGDFDRAFFNLVEEAGAPVDMGTAVALVVGGAIIGGAIPLVLFENLLGAAGGMVLGASLPVAVLLVKRFFRLRKMRQHLPQALQAVADAVRSGQNLSEACELVSQEIKGPLGEEFAYAHSQLELGHSPIGVMNRMVRRVPLPEFRVFATAVVVHRRAGGNLSLLTERMSKAAHDRTDTRNHMLAVTAGSRLSAIGMVLAGVIALIVLGWMQPEYIQTFVEHPRGPWLLATSVLLQVVGAIWVWRILKPLS